MTSQSIDHLIVTLRDGIEFYETAGDRTEDVYLRQLFRQMVSHRSAAIAKLSPYAITPDQDAEGETPGNMAERLWTDLKSLFGNTDEIFLDTLIDVENRTLTEIDSVLKAMPDAEPRTVVAELRREFAKALEDIKTARRRGEHPI